MPAAAPPAGRSTAGSSATDRREPGAGLALIPTWWWPRWRFSRNAGTAQLRPQSLLARVGLLKLIGQLLFPVGVGPAGAGELLGEAGQ